jgi:hypothetical protein
LAAAILENYRSLNVVRQVPVEPFVNVPQLVACLLAGALLTAFVLGLYKIVRAEWRSAVVFPLLGVLQVAQYVLTAGVPCPWWDSLFPPDSAGRPSPFASVTFFPAVGSTVLFPLGLVVFCRLASWLLGANAFLAAVALCVPLLVDVSASPFRSGVFSAAGATLITLGTVLTLADCYILMFTYDSLRRSAFGHLIVPLTVALTFDAVGYSAVLAWLGHTPFGAGLRTHLPAKLCAGVAFGGLLQAFIRRFCPTISRDPPLTVSGLGFLKSLVWPLPLIGVPRSAISTTHHLFSRWWRSGVLVTTPERFERFVTDAVYDVERFALIRLAVADLGRAETDLREWSANHSVNGWMTERDGMLDVLLLGVTAETAEWALRKVRAATENGVAERTGECVVHDHAHPPMPPVSVAELIRRASTRPAPERPAEAGSRH